MSVAVRGGGAPVVASSAPASAVWSATAKSGLVTISGAGLVATGDTAFVQENGRADTFISGTQKVHWEVTQTNNDPLYSGVGYANSTWNPATQSYLGFDTNAVGYFASGQVLYNFGTLATIGTYVQGNVIAIEVDFALGKVWFAVGAGGWNNDILANQNPATGTGGIALSVTGSIAPAYSVVETGGTTPGVSTAKFAAPMTRTISAGFTAYSG